jgi:signal transduction histidine kinase
VQQSNDSIEFSIADTGSGIAPEHLPYIFERFYRADKSRTRATGGAGLGLAIVKQLVEALGGQVHVESTPGKGTEVSFTMPIFTTQGDEEADKIYQPSKHRRSLESIGGEQ